jgi:hypothetical protein
MIFLTKINKFDKSYKKVVCNGLVPTILDGPTNNSTREGGGEDREGQFYVISQAPPS